MRRIRIDEARSVSQNHDDLCFLTPAATILPDLSLRQPTPEDCA